MRTIRLVGTLYREELEHLQIKHEKLQAKNRRLRKRISKLEDAIKNVLSNKECMRGRATQAHCPYLNHECRCCDCVIERLEKVQKGDT